MKLTQKQIDEFISVTEELLEKIKIFEQGIDFAEIWCETETNKRQWIKTLHDAVMDYDFVHYSSIYNNMEFAIITERYLKDIEISIFKEFNTLITPFSYLIPEYQKKVRNILLKVKI